jgi:hypothetical protein
MTVTRDASTDNDNDDDTSDNDNDGVRDLATSTTSDTAGCDQHSDLDGS